VSYLLDLREPATHRVRVTMQVPDAPSGVELQFPAWNNLYQIRDFVRNVSELSAACDGQPSELARLDLHTWRAPAQACATLELRYAVYANEESVFSAVLNEQHAFLNFALLLFYLPHERERAARLKFLLPPRWRVATLLEDGEMPDEFRAPDYDTLFDSPAEVGEFQEYWYQQRDLPGVLNHSRATYRVVVFGNPADYSAERLLASLRKITETATALMRDVPFSRYTFILHFPRGRGGGGMEHRSGTAVSVAVPELEARWESLESVAAHEFFHLWNVKRIRPQALEPIDYVRGNDTRDLWFCEGVTSMYGDLILVRSGLTSRQRFYERLAEEITELQPRPARHYQSLEAAGIEAWLEKYPDYVRPERSISYYNKGALVGYLLDLGLRHATSNRISLDDVMRYLNQEYARRQRTFAGADLAAIITKLAPEFAEADAFFRAYVYGTRELDYDTYLGFAGLRLVRQPVKRSALGFLAARGFDGPIQVESVEAQSNAARAGLQPGDILLGMNGEPLQAPPERKLSGMRPGQKVSFRIRRGMRELTLEFNLETRDETAFRVEETPNPTKEQIELRGAWLAAPLAAQTLSAFPQ